MKKADTFNLKSDISDNVNGSNSMEQKLDAILARVHKNSDDLFDLMIRINGQNELDRPQNEEPLDSWPLSPSSTQHSFQLHVEPRIPKRIIKPEPVGLQILQNSPKIPINNKSLSNLLKLWYNGINGSDPLQDFECTDGNHVEQLFFDHRKVIVQTLQKLMWERNLDHNKAIKLFLKLYPFQYFEDVAEHLLVNRPASKKARME